ncbi:hypothetical protein PG_0723 [Porphyromonas gingivalis W83]|uniref:Uncharacterized protein n=1 Tax=Porphyromonas gingivalis (strain ATCC BAA-308 / W83) TaxID=242619 RepID=Q7MWA8_PORGI|nr:hypothetical protein PG_0723 [Porphyromonas gingivalis W83]
MPIAPIAIASMLSFRGGTLLSDKPCSPIDSTLVKRGDNEFLSYFRSTIKRNTVINHHNEQKNLFDDGCKHHWFGCYDPISRNEYRRAFDAGTIHDPVAGERNGLVSRR